MIYSLVNMVCFAVVAGVILFIVAGVYGFYKEREKKTLKRIAEKIHSDRRRQANRRGTEKILFPPVPKSVARLRIEKRFFKVFSFGKVNFSFGRFWDILFSVLLVLCLILICI